MKTDIVLKNLLPEIQQLRRYDDNISIRIKCEIIEELINQCKITIMNNYKKQNENNKNQQ